MRIDVRVTVAFLFLQTGGCMAGVPPVRVDVGSGARVTSAPPGPRSVDAPVAFRVGPHPLGLIPGNAGRQFDVGVGYVIDAGPDATIQGGYLSEGLFARRTGGVRGFRFGLELQERVLAETAGNVSGVGGGFATRLDLEYADFARAIFSERHQGGGAYGEGAVGLFVEGDSSFVGGMRSAGALGGLTFTLPAAGFAGVK
jgi:hypothetical protein